MRAARADDYRRRLRERADRWKFRLERFAFDGIPSLGQDELPFSSPFTVICGPNGVGKTTLLRAIRAAANPSGVGDDPIAAHKLPSGTATLDFRFEGNQRSSTVSFSQGQPAGGTQVDVDVIHLDIASALSTQQKYLCSFENAADLTNGIGHKMLSGAELDALNYLARRNYREVRLYEVDGGDQDVIPYCEVTLGGSSYDSRSMGAGEFAIFYLWWAIERASMGAMILIEEPECHLSPGSQGALCDFLVEKIVTRMLTIVMTTHSSKIISKLDDENIAFIYRDDRGVQIVQGYPSPALLETVGVEQAIDTIVFVEDEAGAEVGRFLLQAFRPDLARRTEFVDRQGDGNIINALRAAKSIENIGVIGLFDGDVRTTTPADVKLKAAYLPGDEPIEKTLRKMLEADVESMQLALGRPDLGEVLFGLQGHDHHEWYEGLCRNLGQSRRQLYPALLRIWLRDQGNEAASRQAIEVLAGKYREKR